MTKDWNPTFSPPGNPGVYEVEDKSTTHPTAFSYWDGTFWYWLAWPGYYHCYSEEQAKDEAFDNYKFGLYRSLGEQPEYFKWRESVNTNPQINIDHNTQVEVG